MLTRIGMPIGATASSPLSAAAIVSVMCLETGIPSRRYAQLLGARPVECGCGRAAVGTARHTRVNWNPPQAPEPARRAVR